MSLANDLFTFVGHIVAGIGALFALLGISSNLANNTASVVFNVEVDSLSLPIRMTIVILVGAALGWGLGALVAWLSQSRNEALRFGVYVVAIFWGGLIVGAAEWLAVTHRKQILSETLLFTFVGLGLALWVAGFHFRSSQSRESRALAMQCEALLLCAAFGAVFLMLTLLGAQS